MKKTSSSFFAVVIILVTLSTMSISAHANEMYSPIANKFLTVEEARELIHNYFNNTLNPDGDIISIIAIGERIINDSQVIFDLRAETKSAKWTHQTSVLIGAITVDLSTGNAVVEGSLVDNNETIDLLNTTDEKKINHQSSSIVYMETLTPVNSDRYTGNVGDSYIGNLVEYLEKYYSDHEVNKNTYSHCLVAWIARWNYQDEISWAWNEYDLAGQYSVLQGKIVLIKSYNETNFDTKLEIIGDDKVIYSADLTPNNLPTEELSINVSNVNKLIVRLHDNQGVSGGTAFGLADFRLTKESVAEPIDEKNFHAQAGVSIRNNTALLYSPVIDGKQYHLYRIENEKISFANGMFTLVNVPSEIHSYLLDSNFNIVIDPDVLIKAIYLDVANLAVRGGQKEETMSFLKESRQRLTDMENLTQKAISLYNLGSGYVSLSDYVMTIARLVVGDITAIVDFGLDKTKDGMMKLAEIGSYTFMVEEYLRGHALAYNQESIRHLTLAIDMLENQASYSNEYIKNYNDIMLLDATRTLIEIYLEYFWMDMKYFQIKVERAKQDAFRKIFYTALDGLGAPDFMDFSAIADVNITITSLAIDGATIVTTDISTLTDPDLIRMEKNIKAIKQNFAESLYQMHNVDMFGNVELLAIMNREFQITLTCEPDV